MNLQTIILSTRTLVMFSPLWFRDPWDSGAAPYLWPETVLTGLHNEQLDCRCGFDLNFYPSGFP